HEAAICPHCEKEITEVHYKAKGFPSCSANTICISARIAKKYSASRKAALDEKASFSENGTKLLFNNEAAMQGVE
ncbi:hypothetical protein K8I31_18755, partial [bacterium]|nr:hypothetical protein [bacterium]